MKIVLFAVAAFLSAVASGTVKTFSCRVIDRETGLSIVGAKVRASFGNHSIDWNTAGDISLKYATTDADGKCRFTGRTNNDQFGWSVLEAQGYYQADGEYIDFVGPSVMGVGVQVGTKVSTARLDRVINPIPLFIKQVGEGGALEENLFEKGNGIIEYDLVQGDWLPPIGVGKVADLRVTLKFEDLGEIVLTKALRLKKFRNETVIQFCGKGNGIRQMEYDPRSALRVRTAPEDGYRDSLVRWIYWRSQEEGYRDNRDDTRSYCFRIRTEYNEDGTVRSAYYGKIYGDFRRNCVVGNDKDAGVRFTYYLNPNPNDRNLEYDQKTNLNPKCRMPPEFFKP